MYGINILNFLNVILEINLKHNQTNMIKFTKFFFKIY